MLNISFKPHRANLRAASSDAQKVFAMLKIIPEAEIARARPPLALVLVVDTSGSMRETAGAKNKMEQAIDAAHALIDDARLLPQDQVAIIQFADHARTLLPLGPLGDGATASRAIEELRRFDGGTRLGQGLRQAAQELQALPAGIARRVLVLTDGEATDAADCRQLADTFVATGTPLITLGVGTTYNEELLRDLADWSHGRPYPLQNMLQLREVLEHELASLVREVVTDLQAGIATVKGVTLSSMTRVYPSLSEMALGALPLRLGNIAAGDYTVFVLEFTIEGIARPASRARLARVTLQGHAPGLGHPVEAEPQELFMTFTNDDAATASVNPEVLGYVQQKNVDRMMQDAVRQATVDVGTARRTLQTALGMTQTVGNAAVSQILQGALDELNHSGKISPAMRKTVSLAGRTRTIKTGADGGTGDFPSEDEIHRLTGA